MLIIKGLWYNNSRSAPRVEGALLIFLPDEPLCIRWRGVGGGLAGCYMQLTCVWLIFATLLSVECLRSGGQQMLLLVLARTLELCGACDTGACFQSAASHRY